MDFDTSSGNLQSSDSLEKYQRKDIIDSGYNSGFPDKQPYDVNEPKVANLGNIEEGTTVLDKLQMSLDTLAVEDGRDAKLIEYLITAFTPDEDNDTYLTILLSKNEIQQSLQLIKLCPRSCYLDIQNNLGQAGIHIAVYLNFPSVAHKLIMEGAKIDMVDINGKNIFHLCAEQGHLKSLIAILDAGGKTGQVKTMWKLLHERDHTGATPFFLAVTYKHKNICKAFSEMKVNANLFHGQNGNSPLHEAIGNHWDTSFIQFLLRECDLNASQQNWSGATPLHIAASRNDKEICGLLLFHGGDVNIQDINMNFPVDYTSDHEIAAMLKIT